MKERENFWKVFFNQHAARYNTPEKMSGWTKHSLERQMETFFNVFQQLKLNEKQTNILDMGCGPGVYTSKLGEMGYKVIGVDYSEITIRKAINFSKNTKYLIADGYNLPFKDNSFGVIICIGVLQSISDEIKLFQEIKRILQKDGILILITLNILFLGAIIYRFRKYKSTLFMKRYYPFGIIDNLKKIGFYDLQLKPIYIFPQGNEKLEKFLEKISRPWILKRHYPFLFLSHMFFIKCKLEKGKA